MSFLQIGIMCMTLSTLSSSSWASLDGTLEDAIQSLRKVGQRLASTSKHQTDVDTEALTWILKLSEQELQDGPIHQLKNSDLVKKAGKASNDVFSRLGLGQADPYELSTAIANTALSVVGVSPTPIGVAACAIYAVVAAAAQSSAQKPLENVVSEVVRSELLREKYEQLAAEGGGTVEEMKLWYNHLIAVLITHKETGRFDDDSIRVINGFTTTGASMLGELGSDISRESMDTKDTASVDGLMTACENFVVLLNFRRGLLYLTQAVYHHSNYSVAERKALQFTIQQLDQPGFRYFQFIETPRPRQAYAALGFNPWDHKILASYIEALGINAFRANNDLQCTRSGCPKFRLHNVWWPKYYMSLYYNNYDVNEAGYSKVRNDDPQDNRRVSLLTFRGNSDGSVNIFQNTHKENHQFMWGLKRGYDGTFGRQLKYIRCDKHSAACGFRFIKMTDGNFVFSNFLRYQFPVYLNSWSVDSNLGYYPDNIKLAMWSLKRET